MNRLIVCDMDEKIDYYYDSGDDITRFLSKFNISVGNNVKFGKIVTLYCNVVIGNNVTIEDNVVIYKDSEIDDNCIIKEYSSIGSGAIVEENSIIEPAEYVFKNIPKHAYKFKGPSPRLKRVKEYITELYSDINEPKVNPNNPNLDISGLPIDHEWTKTNNSIMEEPYIDPLDLDRHFYNINTIKKKITNDEFEDIQYYENAYGPQSFDK